MDKLLGFFGRPARSASGRTHVPVADLLVDLSPTSKSATRMAALARLSDDLQDGMALHISISAPPPLN
jgi:hypothetical protein